MLLNRFLLMSAFVFLENAQIIALAQSANVTHSVVKTGTVHVKAVSVDGRPLTINPWIDSFKDEAGKDWRDHFSQEDGIGTNIPFGNYHVEASHSLSQDTSGTVEVFQSDVLLILGFEADPIEAEFGRAHGQVSGTIDGLASIGSDDWCKLMSIYRQNQYQSSLLKDSSELKRSHFDFGLVAVGTYIMVCVSGERLIFTKNVQATIGPTVLHLTSGPP